MCEPISITAGIMAAGAAVNIVGQNQNRQAFKGNENQKRIAQDQVIEENRKRATTDYLTHIRLEETLQAQERIAVGEKAGGIAQQIAGNQATAVASAAERGIDGPVVDAIANDFAFKQNQATGQLRINQGMVDQQHQENINQQGLLFTRRIQDVPRYIPRTPPPVDYFTPIFGGIMGTASAGVGQMGKAGAPGPTKAPPSGEMFGPPAPAQQGSFDSSSISSIG